MTNHYNPNTTEAAAREAVRRARSHADSTQMPMKSSAQLDASEAEASLSRRDWPAAGRAALDSLAYSVGVFHSEYQATRALVVT
jgi:hypothetical protein